MLFVTVARLFRKFPWRSTYNLGQNCWDTSEWMRTLAVKITYHNKSSPSPPYQCCFATKNPLMNPQSFQRTLMEGRGEEKHFCDLVGVSIQRNGEIRSLIAFVSTSFVRDCVKRVSAFVQDMRCFQKSSIIFDVGFTKADFLKPFLVK